jgi:hypothetical protein
MKSLILVIYKIESYTGERSLASFSSFIDNQVRTLDMEPNQNDFDDEQTQSSNINVLDEDLSERDFYIELAKGGLFFVVSFYF